MIIQPTDIAIFLVSFAACAYCIVLSRRLKALQNTRDGLGATIMALSKSVSAVTSATSETRQQTGELATRLTTLMKEAEDTYRRLDDLKATLEASEARQAKQIGAARSEVDGMLSDVMERSAERMAEMKRLIRQLEAAPAPAYARTNNTDFLFEDDDPSSAKRTF